MPRLTVLAKVVSKKASVEAVKTELLKLIAPTRKEEGCIEYSLHQDNDDPAVFIFYENWENESCLLKHMNTDHFKHYVNAIDGMIEEKVVHKLTFIE